MLSHHCLYKIRLRGIQLFHVNLVSLILFRMNLENTIVNGCFIHHNIKFRQRHWYFSYDTLPRDFNFVLRVTNQSQCHIEFFSVESLSIRGAEEPNLFEILHSNAKFFKELNCLCTSYFVCVLRL